MPAAIVHDDDVNPEQEVFRKHWRQYFYRALNNRGISRNVLNPRNLRIERRTSEGVHHLDNQYEHHTCQKEMSEHRSPPSGGSAHPPRAKEKKYRQYREENNH